MRSYLFFIAFLLLVSCDEYNSNSADKLRYGDDIQQERDAGDPNFNPAFVIIQDRCINCHTGDHNNWARFRNDDAWISSGLVHRGDPDNSTFIERIINSGHAGADMPRGAGALPDSEYQLLRKWITEMP